jgi:hypothetical protein
MIKVGSRYRFVEPGPMGTRPIVEVLEFNDKEHQVRYRYVGGRPDFHLWRKSENFLAIYGERLS